jgi:hypothetical protein
MVMDRFDFSPLFRSTIGFDRLTRLVDAATRVDSAAVAMKVTGAGLDNGLLHVDVVREVPEAAKLRTIKIGTTVETVQPQVMEQQAA